MKTRLLIFLLLLLPAVHAFGEEFVQEVRYVADEVETFVGSSDDAVIVWGSHTSKAERAIFAYAKEQYAKVGSMQQVPDTELPRNEKLLIIGGPWQNSLTKQLLADDAIEKDVTKLTFGILTTAAVGTQEYMIFSDYAGYENLARPLEQSPLAEHIPIQYVPLAAAAIGLTLLWLWHLFALFFKKIVKAKINSRIMSYVKKKELKQNYKGFKVKGVRIKYREWIAIFGAAGIFALAVSYSFLQEGLDAAIFILVNVLANMVMYSVRHLVRLALDKRHELHTEYVIWYWGAFITIVSGWLGNTFGLAGYTISDKEEHDLKGKIAFVVNAITFIASIIFFTWNLLRPDKFMQMLMIMALSTSALQALPIKPFGGKHIWKWSKGLWWASFIPIMTVYIAVVIIV